MQHKIFDENLLTLSKGNHLTVRDACAGIHCFGATGSGKTSGSGRTIAKRLLSLGLGGLVLCAKSDEADLWEYEYAENTGRSSDIIRVKPQNGFKFNFLTYEMERAGLGAGLTYNLVSMLNNCLELANRTRGNQGEERYWQDTANQLLTNSFDILKYGGADLSINNLLEIIFAAQKDSNNIKWLSAARINSVGNSAAMRSVSNAVRYFTEEFPSLPEKTRASIVSVISSFLHTLTSEVIYDLTCADLVDGDNFLHPDLTFGENETGRPFNGIILLDISLQEYGDLGRYCQTIYKYIWQKAVESRRKDEFLRPTFLWVDEAQKFITSNDFEFLGTARGSGVITVYLTQNLPSYYAALGGSMKAQHETDSLLGNFQTKIFHSNTDHITNEWAAKSIGEEFRWLSSTGLNFPAESDSVMPFVSGNSQSQISMQNTPQRDYVISPRTFTMLANGGRQSRQRIGSIILKGGSPFVLNGNQKQPINSNVIYHEFDQNF